ncbi:hypothetical protein [Thermanaeromonas sp. C210]|uniref:hypothetical protein n=1 Tax=Thermanaeromonas sp. C210 TaxID=2731925 RepID=UPI001566005D|nr:hypothetical protein [Thermanaeromonas sp. C210]
MSSMIEGAPTAAKGQKKSPVDIAGRCSELHGPRAQGTARQRRLKMPAERKPLRGGPAAGLD